jgi:hypothetical protein
MHLNTLNAFDSASIRPILFDSSVKVLNTGLSLSCLIYLEDVLAAIADKTGRFQM